MPYHSAFVFDLDGVLVDTARYHFLAWKRLSASLGYDLPDEVAELTKGVSRLACVDIVLAAGGLSASEEEKLALAERKNRWYAEYLAGMGQEGVLPGAREFLAATRGAGIKAVLASASKNARAALASTGLESLLDAIADGFSPARPKPAPDIFLVAAGLVGAAPGRCVVFEDAAAGIEGARAAGMAAVGLGDPLVLDRADLVLTDLAGADPVDISRRLAAG